MDRFPFGRRGSETQFEVITGPCHAESSSAGQDSHGFLPSSCACFPHPDSNVNVGRCQQSEDIKVLFVIMTKDTHMKVKT